ncbi:MAG: MBL fold metallo-hydrolase [Firmicutes bacterium]|nr:MBL fold metallo-hydrolase [Bacillota bacterium]
MLASGSSGNSIYVSCGPTRILIDLGIPYKTLVNDLSSLNVDPEDTDAILITHEHSDHISGLAGFASRHEIPIYASQGTAGALLSNGYGHLEPLIRPFSALGSSFSIGALDIMPFGIPHDAADPVGFRINAHGIRIGIATDIGHVTPAVRDGLTDCDLFVVESNHDVGMLMSGNYPWPLKRRIRGGLGHLSNEESGELLSSVVTSRTRQVFLAHISEHNNLPELALLTAIAATKRRGVAAREDLKIGLTYHHRMTSPIAL